MTKLVAPKKGVKQAKKPTKGRDLPAVSGEVEAAAADVASAAASSVNARASSYQAADSLSDMGGGSALPILGGLVVAGGVAAFALGGGEKNVAPTLAATLAASGNEDTASQISISASDSNGDVLTYSASTPANGTVSVAGNVVTYTPKANFNGSDTFTVTVADAKGLSATQAVTVTVAAVNDVPVFSAASQAASTNEDTAKAVTLAATDIEGDALTYSAATPANGTVSVSGSTVTYTPKLNFNGTDSFVVTASDGKGGTATQTINMTVAAVNDAPTFATAAQAVAATEDTAKAVTLAATDVDTGDTLTYTAGAAANGTVVVSGATATYTPNLNFNGTDSFVVTASDGKGGTATQTVNVTVAAVDDAPVISAASTRALTVAEDASATFVIDATDVDTAATALVASVVTAPANGTISTNAAGDNVYTPNANFNGTDSFVVGVSDGTTRTTYTVNVTVSAVDETVSIDVTDDATATTYSAAGDIFHFTDNSGQKTNAIITGMTSGDTVDVTGASSDYSFTSVGSDIQITYNNTAAGALNVIVLKGIAGNSFISDEASAEAAAGFNFFNAATQPSGSGTSGTAGAGGNLDVDSDANALTQAIVTAAGANNFTEDANVASFVKINGFGSDDTITVSNAATSAYSFTSLGTDLKISYTTSAGVVNDITLAGVIAAGTFISSEASAEAALGRDFFKTSVVQESASSTSIDVGTSSATATVSGAGGAITFADDATKNSFVKITNFTAGDSIRVTGATEGQYSFSSSDLDGDGSADDLSISYSDTGLGVVNDIQILNAVSPSAFIFDKATAVSAVGFNFITFG